MERKDPRPKGSPEAKPMPMPAFGEKLSATEMQDLLTYLKTQ